jgi:hypothetical protein
MRKTLDLNAVLCFVNVATVHFGGPGYITVSGLHKMRAIDTFCSVGQ